MSNIKISEMAEAESLNDNDLLTIVQSGINKKITKQNAIGDIIQAINNPTYTTTEGTDLSIDNTRVGKMKFEYYGDTEQENTTGINLFSPYDTTTQTLNGVERTTNTDGSITLTGTATADSYFRVTNDITLESNTAYTTLNQNSNTPNGVTIYYNNLGNIGLTYNDTVILPNGRVKAYTTGSVTGTISIAILVQNGVTVNATLYPMLVKGTITTSNIPNYEPYTGGIASPNPDYPQEVKTVTGENTINVLGKNICPDTFSKYTIFSPYTQYNLPIKVGTECIMSFTDNDTSIDISGCYIGFKDSGTGAPTAIRWCINNGSVLSNTTNIPSTGTDWCGTICIYPNTEEAFNKLFGRYKIQVEKGNTISNYIPYQSQSYEINLASRNIFDYSKNIITNAFIDNVQMKIVSDNNCKLSFCKCKPNTTYTISRGTPLAQRFAVGTTTNLPTIGETLLSFDFDNSGESITITTGANANYIVIRFIYNEVNDYETYAKTIQVEKGSTATPYKEFWQIELAKISTYKDKIYNDGGKWFKHKEIGKLLLNGSQTITLAGSGVRRFNANYTSLGITNILEGTTSAINSTYKMCDHFIYDTSNSVWGNYYLYNNWLVLFDSGSVIADATALASWFTNNNTTIYYILATPIEEEITEPTLINQLNAIKFGAESYYGQTNIMVTSEELQPTLKVQTLDKIGD